MGADRPDLAGNIPEWSVPGDHSGHHGADERTIAILVAENFYFLVTNFTSCVIRHLGADTASDAVHII